MPQDRNDRGGGTTPCLDAPAAELNLRILASLALYVRDRFRADAVDRLAVAGGISPEDLGGGTRWASLEQFESILACARSMMRSDDEFEKATAYLYKERALGLMRYLPWATGLVLGYERGCKSIRLISRISHWEMRREGRALVFRYRGDRPESKLMCLSRRGQLAAFPTMWDLPPARVVERCCVAEGASHCEYVVRTFQPRHWLPSVAGAATGLLLCLLAHLPGVPPAFRWASYMLPVLGFAIGKLSDTLRTLRVNDAAAADVSAEYTKLAVEEADARRELLDFHKRQREWSHMLEEQLNERTRMLKHVADGIEHLQEQRVHTLRGFSHDLRNPLSVLRAGTQFLHAKVQDPLQREMLEEMAEAETRMTRMLSELMESATGQARGLLDVMPQAIQVRPLAESLHRRLRALTHGRDIRASVFSTREAPESVELDSLLLDRVIDNLFTNAVKYTDKGSILVEVTGTPGFLTIKISDSGRGITEDQIEAVFRPGTSESGARAADSYGVGLSVVVQLMDQIGGRIEVMSRPGEGTTFWVHFPIASVRNSQVPSEQPRLADQIQRVVTIRPAHSA